MTHDVAAAVASGSAGREPRRSWSGRSWLAVITLALAATAAGILVWSGMHPTGNFQAVLFALLVAGPTGICWLVLTIVAANAGIVERRRPSWLVLSAIVGSLALVVAGFGLTRSEAAEAVGFAVARPALEQAVESGECPSTVGPFAVLRCESHGDTGSIFMIDGAGFLHRAGWAHFGDGAEAAARMADSASPYSFVPVADGWYRVVYDWN